METTFYVFTAAASVMSRWKEEKWNCARPFSLSCKSVMQINKLLFSLTWVWFEGREGGGNALWDEDCNHPEMKQIFFMEIKGTKVDFSLGKSRGINPTMTEEEKVSFTNGISKRRKKNIRIYVTLEFWGSRERHKLGEINPFLLFILASDFFTI